MVSKGIADGDGQSSYREETRRRRLDRGLLADGDEPVYVEHYLVEVWRLHAAGREADARQLLAGVWSWAMDNFNEHLSGVALRLLVRFGFTTDDAESWSGLPNELQVF